MEILHSTVIAYVHENGISRPFNIEEYQYDPLKTNSKGTCSQWTTCIKWTLGRVLRLSAYRGLTAHCFVFYSL